MYVCMYRALSRLFRDASTFAGSCAVFFDGQRLQFRSFRVICSPPGQSRFFERMEWSPCADVTFQDVVSAGRVHDHEAPHESLEAAVVVVVDFTSRCGPRFDLIHHGATKSLTNIMRGIRGTTRF